MVYTLSNYSYSFIRRLRELATPLEAYNLQIADIDTTCHLKPLQTLTNDNSVYGYSIDFDQNTVTDIESPHAYVDITNSTLLAANGIKFHHLTSDTFDTRIFNHFLLKPNSVEFANCFLDATLIHNVKQRIQTQPTIIKLDHCVCDPNYTITVMLECFPFCKTLRLRGSVNFVLSNFIVTDFRSLFTKNSMEFFAFLEITEGNATWTDLNSLLDDFEDSNSEKTDDLVIILHHEVRYFRFKPLIV
uniref:LRR containing protein n=1 Tax=Panagrellus redivivus TaxID=6233 RepID=A0A7E4VRU5_PANRE